MSGLDDLIGQAAACADPGASALPRQAADAEQEALRILQICNACRYCEGYCAVFQSMTRRLSFDTVDVRYLANLCHNCGSCLHACQYAPPHEFAVNVPQTMARVRLLGWRRHAWPRVLGRLYTRNGLVLAWLLAAGSALFLVLALLLHGTLWHAQSGGDFYAVFPHDLMAGVFGLLSLGVLLALGVGCAGYWREIDPGGPGAASLADAVGAVAGLRYLGGGHGQGCNNEDDRFSLARRNAHHALFYGFGLCLLATCVATLYHYLLRLPAPYPYTSLPVVLGMAGGAGIVVGGTALLALRLRRDPRQGDPDQAAMDLGFTALLLLVALTGLVLAVLRASAAMPALLALHLGAVFALFATMPYGRFMHAPLRVIALVKWAVERRRAAGVAAAGD